MNGMHAMFGLAMASALSASAASFEKYNVWFDQNYSGFDSAGWTDTLGQWKRPQAGTAEYAGGKIDVATGDEQLVFTPNAKPASGSTEVLKFEVIFDEASPFLDSVSAENRQAAFSLARDGAGFVFVGASGGAAIPLFGEGIEPMTNVEYTVEITLDHGYSPAAVAYSVNGVPMKDADGNVVLRGNAKKSAVSSVGVAGKGTLGVFSGSVRKEARAGVVVSRQRPRVGNAVTCAVNTNENAELVGELAYRWKAVNWDGSGDGAAKPTAGASYVPTAADYAKWIVVEAYDDAGYAGEGRMWFSRLPVAYIDVADGAWPTPSKEDHDATVAIYGNDVYKDQYDGPSVIKVRGNSTAGLPKRPYKLKLDSKTNLFGFGKNKHWVLLANYYDESMMRNRLAYDFANDVGSLGMKSEWVDVVMNGEYNGIYQLCQHIRVGSDRIDVFDWETAGEDAADAIAADCGFAKADKKELETQMSENFAWVTSDEVEYAGTTYKVSDHWEDFGALDITGGYIFEHSYEFDATAQFAITSGATTVLTMLNSPERLETNEEMMRYCRGLWQDFFDATTSADGFNKGLHFSELCDIDSMVAYWLTLEMFGNNDSSWKSRFAYKPHDEKIKFGPVWDFDWGVGGTCMSDAQRVPTGWKAMSGGTYAFYKEWLTSPYFCQKAVKKYHEIRQRFNEMIREGGLIDQYEALLAESAAANTGKWQYKLGFVGDLEYLRYYLENRLTWLDAQFADVATLIAAARPQSATKPYVADAAKLPVAYGDTVVEGAALSGQNVTFAGEPSGGVVTMSMAVNGVKCEGRTIPAAALSGTVGDTNVVELCGFDGNGGLVARNYSLLATRSWPEALATAETTDPATGEAVPSVPMKWVRDTAVGAVAELSDSVDASRYREVLMQRPSVFGKAVPLWYDYVAGTKPEDKDDLFTAAISFEGGVPKVEPDPNLGSERKYTILGKESVGDAEEWRPATPSSKFFKVRVELP